MIGAPILGTQGAGTMAGKPCQIESDLTFRWRVALARPDGSFRKQEVPAAQFSLVFFLASCTCCDQKPGYCDAHARAGTAFSYLRLALERPLLFYFRTLFAAWN